MGTPTQAQMIRLVTRLIYETVREQPCGVPAGVIYAALQTQGCTKDQFDTFIDNMKVIGLVAEHPTVPDILVCPDGHDAVAHRLGM